MDSKETGLVKKYAPQELTKFNNELRALIEKLMEDESIKTKVQLFKDSKFTVSWFYKRGRKYADYPRTQSLIKKIDEILEARLIDHGLHKANYGFVIFLLKNHYGYQDKREVETETTHVFKVTRGDLKTIKKHAPKFIPPNQES